MEHTIGPSTLRVALYGRVSTLDKGQDVNLQLNELREYSDRRGWKIAGEYVDNGVSGAKESRPELNRMMADAKKRKFDAIAVWKLDRFGRSLKHLVMTLADLESLGIAFVSLRDGFDLSTPSDCQFRFSPNFLLISLVFHALSAFSIPSSELTTSKTVT
jgi:DNA invertase Pin-like site-specific DNA recombinase